MVNTGVPKTAYGQAAPKGAVQHVLLLRARSWVCALPIRSVVETMRALPVRPVEGAPPFLRGLSIIRGALLPVVNLAALLGAPCAAQGRRFVTVRTGERQIALEVDEVVGARQIDELALESTPPLLSEAMPEPIEKLGVLDGQTLALLDAARLIPAPLWEALEVRDAR